MRRLAELMVCGGVAGAVSLALATALDEVSTRQAWPEAFKWALPGALAGTAGAWLAGRWQQRRPVRAGLLALRTLLVFAACYPLACALYVAAVIVLPALWQGDLARLHADGHWFWLVLLLGCLPLLWAALPFSLFAYIACWRHTRRTVAVAPGCP